MYIPLSVCHRNLKAKQKTANRNFHYLQWPWLDRMAKVLCLALGTQSEELYLSHLERLVEHLDEVAETPLSCPLCRKAETL